jgi:hypothetical protein
VEEAVEHAGASPTFNWNVAVLSSVVALLGIYLAYLMYGSKKVSPESMANRTRPVYTLLYRKYFMDELYEQWIVQRFFYGGVVRATWYLDQPCRERSRAGSERADTGRRTGDLGRGRRLYRSILGLGELTDELPDRLQQDEHEGGRPCLRVGFL